ncbi:MAG: hypothetical protein HDR74_01325 [Bacteroides sp.]|nr:hypothetical protein [Bacteroides sp.]
MKSRVLKADEIRVSEPTTALINALQSTSAIYSEVHTALCVIYSERDALDIINTRLYPELTALEARIRELLAMSIAENLSNIESDTI